MRIAFVDHSFHQKTRSTFFLRDLLVAFSGAEIDNYWWDGWKGREATGMEAIDPSRYDYILFLQEFFDAAYLRQFPAEKLILVPMYDSSKDWLSGRWRSFASYKFLSFSRSLDAILSHFGLSFVPVTYWPEPQAQPMAKDGPLTAFWWRRNTRYEPKRLLEMLARLGVTKLHLHDAPDPGQPPLKSVSYAGMEIQTTTWFEQKRQATEAVARHDIYVAPRTYEGIGMSFLEAMALGRCVIATPTGTMNQYVEHQSNGLFFSLHNYRLPSLSPEAVRNLGKNAAQGVATGHLSWLQEGRELAGQLSALAPTPHGKGFDWGFDLNKLLFDRILDSRAPRIYSFWKGL